MICPFCDQKNLDNLTLRASEFSLAIINRFPINVGHLLIIPKRHVIKLEDMDTDETVDFFDLLTLFWKTMNQAFKVPYSNFWFNQGTISGQNVEHIHLHLMPRHPGDNMINSQRRETIKKEIAPEEIQMLFNVLKS